MEEYWPFSQIVHAVEPIVVENVSLGQLEQMLAPAAEYVPETQDPVTPSSPDVPQKLPAEQLVQLD